MDFLIVLFAHKQSRFIFDKVFNEESSLARALKWAKKLRSKKICVLTHEEIKDEVEREMQRFSFQKEFISAKNEWTLQGAIEEIAKKAENFKSVVFAFADEPFLSVKLSEKLLQDHARYKSEFTFAEGFVGGLSPEIIDTGTLKILRDFLKEKWQNEGKTEVTRAMFSDLIMKEPNSFDIESVLSNDDARLFRIFLNAEKKRNLFACRSAFEEEEKNPSWDEDLGGVNEFSSSLCLKVSVMQTLPAYYSLEISAKSNLKSIYLLRNSDEKFMEFSDFESISEKIKNFSSDAVVSLSIFGEPLLHPNFLDFCARLLSFSLTPLVETDGFLIDENLCGKLSEIEKNFESKIIWILRLDAVSEEMYEKIHGFSGLSRAQNAVNLLSSYFPERVYAQFVRMKTNESELEKFFRKWSDIKSATGGKYIIQKYSNFCGALKDEEVADFSPLKRNACWHLCRDMCIFSDGKVPLCRENAKIVGDALTEDLGEIWARFTPHIKEHFRGEYNGGCEKCDEYYTFNF